MFIRSPGWQTFITLCALVSVLLGTFEHEDLIFQNHRSSAAIETIAVDLGSVLHDSFETASRESGTHGTYRSESHRLWLLPKHKTSYSFEFHPAPRLAPPPCPSPGLQLSSRPRIADIVAMRI